VTGVELLIPLLNCIIGSEPKATRLEVDKLFDWSKHCPQRTSNWFPDWSDWYQNQRTARWDSGFPTRDKITPFQFLL